MSGPVWRILRGEPSTCSRCGKSVDHCRAVGEVVDGAFVITRRFCDDCYRTLGRLLDQVA
jgi:hypothetical protein